MTISRPQVKTVLILILLLLLPALIFAGGKKEKSEAPETQTEAPARERTPIEVAKPGENAAVVNGSPIGLKRFEQLIEAEQQRAMMQGMQISQDQLAELKKQALDYLINMELLSQEAKKAGYQAEPEQVQQQINQIKGQFEGEEEFKQALASEGTDEATIREDIKKSIMVQKFVMERFASEVTVEESETRDYYDRNPQVFMQPEQVRASHILFTVDQNATAEEVAAAKEKAENALKRYRDGEEFSSLAQELSQCPSSAQGGDLGLFGRNQMVPEFEQKAFSLKVGEVSEPLRTQYGFHLIRLTAKNDESRLAYDEIKDQITEHLREVRFNELLESFLEERKEESEITRYM
jgi:peptidyl-prolyl cis-trans isomerase C